MINQDWRWLSNGLIIPSEAGYSDQPSIVKAPDGTWVCSVTTGKGIEGAQGQYVSITRSADRGHTWTEPVALEDPQWESAYSSLAVAPSGRIYCFYCYNMDHVDIRAVPLRRYDMGGYYCFRFSEDCGRTWSERRVVPVRDFDIDDSQPREYAQYNGKPLRFFWNVSRIFFDGDTFYSALIKYQYDPSDILHRSEGVLLRCEGLDRDMEHARWETLPEGRTGIRTPAGGGPIAEEQCYVKLSDGTIFVTFRTVDGCSACTLSRDGGRTFQSAQYMRYSNGRPMKHNRAANFIWPLGGGRYLYWFNNHGLRSYDRRNPVWCSLGTEVPGPDGLTLSFSEPEILLYHEGEHVRMSYPDLLWDDGWYVTETQKTEARIHRIDDGFIEKLISQAPCRAEPVLLWHAGEPLPELHGIVFSRNRIAVSGDQRELVGDGCTLALSIEDAQPGETLLSSMGGEGGVKLSLDSEGFLLAEVGDCMAACTLHGSIPLSGGRHDLALIVDPRANVLYAVTDGVMDDGGDRRTCGWQWMNRAIAGIPGGLVQPGRAAVVFSVYDTAMMTCEAAGIRKGSGT